MDPLNYLPCSTTARNSHTYCFMAYYRLKKRWVYYLNPSCLCHHERILDPNRNLQSPSVLLQICSRIKSLIWISLLYYCTTLYLLPGIICGRSSYVGYRMFLFPQPSIRKWYVSYSYHGYQQRNYQVRFDPQSHLYVTKTHQVRINARIFIMHCEFCFTCMYRSIQLPILKLFTWRITQGIA